MILNIKPCPFCGHDDAEIKHGWQVECRECFAEGPQRATPHLAVDAWNAREVENETVKELNT